jgi:Methyltransferase domain
MDRCGCDGYATPIDAKLAENDRRAYHAKGPERTTLMLLEMIMAASDSGATLLDVGGGIGVIDHELLRSGARSAVLVEASSAYLDAAREEAQEAGLLDRLTIVAGDFVRRAADIDAADIVTLDRVVCCYPGADALITASAEKSMKLLGLVLPRDRWYVRWAIRLDNVRWWSMRSAYRARAHANARIDELAMANNLRPIS